MIIVYHGLRPWESSRHQGLMEGYARRVPLVYLDPNTPSSPSSAADAAWVALREAMATGVDSGLFPVRLQGALPGGRFRPIAQMNRWLAVRRLIAELRRIRDDDIVLVSQQPGMLPTARHTGASLTVYEIRDNYAGFSLTDAHARRTEAAHRAMLEQTDIAWAISRALVEDASEVRSDVQLTSVGVELDSFAQAEASGAPRAMLDLPSPRIGLVGNLNDRLDWQLVEKIAGARPDWQIVLVGPIYHSSDAVDRELRSFLAHPNAHHIDAVPREQMGATVAAFDVCMIPYRITVGTSRINSLKVFQFLAAGKPVVASRIRSIEELSDVVRCAEPHEFIGQIEAALEERGEPWASKRKERVAPFDWSAVADHQITMIERALADREGLL